MITESDFKVYYSGAVRSINRMAAAGLSIDDLVDIMLATLSAESLSHQSEVMKAAVIYARSKGMKNQEEK